MNRSYIFNYIEEKLSSLSYRIGMRARINLLDLNIYSEAFFAELLNILFDLKLRNMNAIKQNVEGIDLIDEKNKIIVQISSTCKKQKIECSLEKSILKEYQDYSFKFFAIYGNADKLRNNTFNNPHGISFFPENDIYDIKRVLNVILNFDISKQRKVYDFIKGELGSNIDIIKMDSNLATIINIIASEDLSGITEEPQISSFEISRKIEFNDLLGAQYMINDYKVYYNKLDEKYQEFDRQGSNKSFSVLSVLRKQYYKLLKEEKNQEAIFFRIIDDIIEMVIHSKNYTQIPYEELELCVSILVVDAFIRCKIFENPEGYNYVVTR